MASRNKDERDHVNMLVKAIQKNSPNPAPYIFIDRDAGNMRHTSSGWDLQLARKGKIVYIEAKEKNAKLSDWQELTCALIRVSGAPYLVVRFWEDGKYYSIEDEGGHRGQYRTEKASITDFIE